jgi:hypothetical protein
MSQLNVNNITKYTGGEVVVNDASEDVDFRVESDGNANMLTVNAGSNLVGIASDPDLGVGLHIKSADSGASVHADSDELVIEGSGASGLSILSGASSNGKISFNDSGGNSRGAAIYEHDGDNLRLQTAAADALKIDSAGSLILPKSGQGIYLGVTAATAANLLDDYEEGTWTVQDTDGGGSAQSGMYTKIGNLVTCYFHFTTGSISGSDQFNLTNLPFTVGATDAFRGPVSISYTNATTMPLAGNVSEGETKAYLLIGTGDIATDDEIGASKVIAASMIYRV